MFKKSWPLPGLQWILKTARLTKNECGGDWSHICFHLLMAHNCPGQSAQGMLTRATLQITAVLRNGQVAVVCRRVIVFYKPAHYFHPFDRLHTGVSVGVVSRRPCFSL